MVGLQLQQVAVQLDGARHVVEPLLVQIRDPVLEADSLGGVARHLALAQQNAQELGPVLRLLVQHVEADSA